MWNWQQKNWPNFKYQKDLIEPLEKKFLRSSGEHLGILKYINEQEQLQLRIELISEESLKTSKIEGEILNRESLQSSIRKEFGIKTDNHKIPKAEQGISKMMVDLYKNFDQKLNHQLLFNWHKKLMLGRSNLKEIGKYRTHKEPMQIVSGAMYAPKIHFEAPASKIVKKEMNAFVDFFNKEGLPALTKAAIVHLYFVSIHPFEDGNGRIARALAEKSLAQNLGHPSLIALSYIIESHRKQYYEKLESSNKHNEITNWILYFANTILAAQDYTKRRLEFLVEKAKFYDKMRGQLNIRQVKVINRMFEEGIEGFKGGLSADNYISITKAPRTTTTRDLRDLVKKGALIKKGELRYTRYYLNIESVVAEV